MQSTRPALTPASVVEQIRSAPPGRLYCLHGSSSVFRLSLYAAAHVLLNNVPVVLVDGSNRFDIYYLAEFARRYADGARGQVTPEQLLRNIFISRAFTCYQMEAVLTERLPAFVRLRQAPVVLIFGLLDTFYDEQAPLFEVRASLQRIMASLRHLSREHISVLLASADAGPVPSGRQGLLRGILAGMDKVFTIPGHPPAQAARTRTRRAVPPALS